MSMGMSPTIPPVVPVGSPREARQGLEYLLRRQAKWRQEKFEEYPDDDRNAMSAAALEALADDVHYLDDAESDSLMEFWALINHDGAPVIGERVERAISRYGFDTATVLPAKLRGLRMRGGGPQTVFDFINNLIALARQDRATTEDAS